MCTNTSGVPSPRVKKPKPRTRLNTHHGPLPVAFRRDDDVRALRQLRRVDGRALVHAEDAEGLHALRAAQHLGVDPCSLVGCLVAAGPKAGDVEQDVGKPVVGHDEPVTL